MNRQSLSGEGAAHTQVGKIPSPFRCDQCYRLISVGLVSSSALCQTGPWWGQGMSEALMLMYAGTWSICAHFAACPRCCAALLNCCVRQLGSILSPPAFGMGCMNPKGMRGRDWLLVFLRERTELWCMKGEEKRLVFLFFSVHVSEQGTSPRWSHSKERKSKPGIILIILGAQSQWLWGIW